MISARTSTKPLTRFAWLSILTAIITMILKGIAWRMIGAVGHARVSGQLGRGIDGAWDAHTRGTPRRQDAYIRPRQSRVFFQHIQVA